MSYNKPNAFVSIQIAEAAAAPQTPEFYPAMIAAHFFMAYKEEVVDAGKDYYAGLPLNNIAYPNLPKESIDTGNYLLVDVGDLTPGANDPTGSPNIERFDPDVFIITDAGAEIDISLAEGLNVLATNFTVPGNITFNSVTGAYKATKGDIVNGDMDTTSVSDWTVLSTTNDPAIIKDVANKDYANNYCLKITLHGTPDAGDGVKSTAFTVVGGESYEVIIRSKKDSGAGVNFDLEVWDEGAGALISGADVNDKSNTDYDTTKITFTVPDTCSSITIRGLAAAATAGGIFYLGSIHLLYQGTDALTGKITISYRAFEERYTGQRLQRLEASSLADLQALFGTDGLGPANPLGYMMYNAWVHSGLTVRGVAVGNPAANDGTSTYSGKLDDEVLSFTASKDFMNQSPDDYYALALGTWNEAVWDVFSAYMNSQESSKRNWSRMVVATEIDTQITFRRGVDGSFMGMFSSVSVGGFTDKDTIIYNSTNYEVRVVDGVAYVALPFSANQTGLNFTYNSNPETDGVFTIVDNTGVTYAFTSASAGNFLASGYKKVKINDRVTIRDEISLVTIVRSDVIVMKHDSGAEVSAGLNQSYDFSRYLTLDGTSTGIADKTTMAEMTRDRAKAYLQDRMIIVVPGWNAANINNVWTDVESWYAAAQVAAEMCYPTALAIPRGPGFPVGLGFTGLREAQTNDFRAIRYFNENQLDIIGSGGNLILENINPGEVMFARHSLTTDMTSIETQEIMMGVARDYVAYSFRKTMETLVKRMRVAAPLGSALKMRLEGLKVVLVEEKQVVQDITITDILPGSTPDKVTVLGTMIQFYPLNQLDIDIKVIQPQPFTVSI